MLKNRTWAIGIGIVVVVIVALVLATQLTGTQVSRQNITPAQYVEKFGDGNNADYLLIDVRTPEEYNGGHIPGAINISVETLGSRLNEVPKDQPVVVYCRTGNRSATAAGILENAGYGDIYDLGGIVSWTAAGLPTE